jgi:hypothetical protein
VIGQKLILIDACITRGERAAIAAPKLEFVCLNCAVHTFVAVHAVPPGFT